MTLTFEDILASQVDDLPNELQLPAGTWRFRCRAVTPKEDAVLLTLEPVAATDDVDQDELNDWEEEKDEDPVVFHRLRGTPRNVGAQLKTLCRLVSAKTPRDLVDVEFYATLTYDPNKKDPSRPWPRLKGFQAVTGDEE